MRHTFSGRMTSSEEIMVYLPVAFWIMFTVGLDLVKKNTARHTIQNVPDFTKVWRLLSIFVLLKRT